MSDKLELSELVLIGIKQGILIYDEVKNRITYVCGKNHSEKFSDPEEKVRAAFFVELCVNYLSPKEKIEIEVTVPRRTPEDRADIVIYEDDERKKPYLVVESLNHPLCIQL